MMRFTSFRYASLALGAALIGLAGCSQPADPAAADSSQAASAKPAEPSQALDTYRQLVRIGNDEMAVTVGKDIVSRAPASAAAQEVQQSLPAIEKRWTETSEKNRLQALWLYQTSPMEGGTQSTATIYSSRPSGDRMVRLILRRHTAWGQSVFLFGSGHGFDCKGNCTISAKFDDSTRPIKGFLPTTGEPAMFIRDDAAFIKALQKAKKITLEVTSADQGKQTLVYEVAGFQPDKWAAVGKGGKTK
jgi:hypothetical protein